LINLYIVESPLQALCALEVALGKKNELHDIIVRTSSGGERVRNDSQMLLIVEKFNWNYKKIIFDKKDAGRFSINSANKDFIKGMKEKYKNNITSLYIGEFNSSVTHMVRMMVDAPNVFLLDDGAVTVKVIKNYINNGYNYPYDNFYPKNILKKIVYKFLNRSYIDLSLINKDIKILTAFSSEESDKVIKVNFKNIKKLGDDEKKIDNSVVYYFGSLYSEAKIVSRDYEISVLSKVKYFYTEKNKNIIYFAHRDESQEKLDFIESNLGFRVIKSELTAELFILESNTLPYEVAGAYTSVLNNIKVIFPEVSLRSFRLASVELCDRRREAINEVYNYYQGIGIVIES
jgi:hypothetical protein